MYSSKIINDPVYGFLTIPSPLIHQLIQHPFFQRLRRIKQLGVTDFVYPGATHSRFHHALGALNLMVKAVETLRQKGVKISDAESDALFAGILLHDVGHGPYSHSLENSIVSKVPHESISYLLMKKLNDEMNGQLDLMLKIFSNQYKKPFLHQLISGQLDMDRLDYLSRDSFFTGVIEGQVGAERIIHMLNVREDELVVEEKGIYSIEKFIIARRLMYWQVYLHKTVVAADILLINIMKRARAICQIEDFSGISKSLKYFLTNEIEISQLRDDEMSIQHFINLDDADIICAIKDWQLSQDKVLSQLSKNFINRNLPKVELSPKPFTSDYILECQKAMKKKFKIESDDMSYFLNNGMLKNDAYLVDQINSIKILKKDNQVLDVAEASDNYNLKAFKTTVKKYYLCFYR
ncbi:MAG: HD domain-containing protein [Bacteroidota bacterium]|nr:HD domain-containing protein [Bacteroidota bacterium]